MAYNRGHTEEEIFLYYATAYLLIHTFRFITRTVSAAATPAAVTLTAATCHSSPSLP